MIGDGLGLYRPSCNTGQGVLCCGEDKECLASHSEGNRFLVASLCVGGGLNRAEVLIGPFSHSIETRSRSIYS